MMGSYNRDFASKWRRLVEADLGKDGSKITSKTVKSLMDKVSSASDHRAGGRGGRRTC